MLPSFMAQLTSAAAGPPMAKGATAAEKSRARQQLISQHNSSLRSVKDMVARSDLLVHLTHSQLQKRPSGIPAARSMGRCSPIAIEDLLVGTTHRRRVLIGTLLVEPVPFNAIATLLEDGNGDVVSVRSRFHFICGMFYTHHIRLSGSRLPTTAALHLQPAATRPQQGAADGGSQQGAACRDSPGHHRAFLQGHSRRRLRRARGRPCRRERLDAGGQIGPRGHWHACTSVHTHLL